MKVYLTETPNPENKSAQKTVFLVMTILTGWVINYYTDVNEHITNMKIANYESTKTFLPGKNIPIHERYSQGFV